MKLNKKTLALMLTATLSLGAIFTGCNRGGSDDSKGGNGGKKKIAIVVKSTDSPYWQTVKKGAEDAAKKYDVEISFLGAPGGESDINGQVNIVENVINQKVDGLVLASSDQKALGPVADKVADAGIPIVLIDSATDTEKYIAYATTNNEDASYQIGKKLGELVGKKGKVAIVSFTPGAGSAIARESGFKKAIKELYPDMEVVTTQYCDSDKAKALSITQDILTSNPDLVGIYGANEQSLVGVARAVKEKGSKVTVVGFDSSDDVIQLLKDGIIKATAVQMPYEMGYLGVENIIKNINGEKIEKNVDTGTTIVTPENMNDADSKKALYPLE